MLEELIELGKAVSSGITQSPHAMEQALRLRTLAERARHPLVELARALRVRPGPDPWLTFRSFPDWPVDLAQTFRHLPTGFVDGGASLGAAAALWAFHLVLARRPGGVLELGCGTSTLLFAVALERLADPLGRARHLAIEADPARRTTSERALRDAGLLANVELCNALDPADLSGIDFAFLGHRASGDSSGVIRALPEGARILLEGGARGPMDSATAAWARDGLVRRVAFVAHQPGLVLLERIAP